MRSPRSRARRRAWPTRSCGSIAPTPPGAAPGRWRRAGEDAASPAPSDWVRDYLEAQRNYFPDLDEAGEAPRGGAGARTPGLLRPRPAQRLLERHGVEVRVMPADVMTDTLRRYDHHRRRLLISERLRAARPRLRPRLPAVPVRACATPSRPMSRASGAPDAVTAAAAAGGPGQLRGGRDADALRGVPPALRRDRATTWRRVAMRFGASFEQVCHRLTTLSRPTARGIPFFMLRIDAAGNVSKRFSGGAFPFSRLGGGCPRWNIHAAFRSPGRDPAPGGRDPGRRPLLHPRPHRAARGGHGRRTGFRTGRRGRLRAEIRAEAGPGARAGPRQSQW